MRSIHERLTSAVPDLRLVRYVRRFEKREDDQGAARASQKNLEDEVSAPGARAPFYSTFSVHVPSNGTEARFVAVREIDIVSKLLHNEQLYRFLSYVFPGQNQR